METTMRLSLDDVNKAAAEAERAFLRGWELMHLFDFESYEEAVISFLEAIEKDPSFARAHSALAETYSHWGFRRELSGLESRSYYELAYEQAQIALTLAPERADSHRAMAVALRRGEKKDLDRRKGEMAIAVDLDPNDPDNWYEMWRACGYRPDDPGIDRALELDPAHCGAHNDLAVSLCEIGRLDEALHHLLLALQRNPRNSLTLYNLAMVLDRKGLPERALKTLEKARRMYPEDFLISSGVALLLESGNEKP